MRTDPVVLIVEDEPHVQRVLESFLKDSYEILTAATGREALDQLNDGVDIVLLDRVLPDVADGKILEEIHQRSSARIAIVTAIDPDYDIIDMDFDDYLVKPVSADQLNETVERLLTLREYDQILTEYLATARKWALLLEEKSSAELEGNEKFSALEAELLSLERRAESLRRKLPHNHSFAIFSDLDTPDR